MNKYFIRESEHYFNRLEGVLRSELFGERISFEAKKCGEIYAERCADFFEKLTLENEIFSELVRAGIDYIADLLDERGDEFDLGVEYYEEITAENFVKMTIPQWIVFERHELLSDEECPAAFSIKMALRAVPDEIFELAMQEEKAIYAGEYRGVSPWNDRLLKKKWNYIG